MKSRGTRVLALPFLPFSLSFEPQRGIYRAKETFPYLEPRSTSKVICRGGRIDDDEDTSVVPRFDWVQLMRGDYHEETRGGPVAADKFSFRPPITRRHRFSRLVSIPHRDKWRSIPRRRETHTSRSERALRYQFPRYTPLRCTHPLPSSSTRRHRI